MKQSPEKDTPQLLFDKGTLLLRHLDAAVAENLPEVRWDARVRSFRAPAFRYREIVLALRNSKQDYRDDARNFAPVALPLQEKIVARPHQTEAFAAWVDAGSHGVVTLPTGAGKTILAVMLIERTERPTLIHVPTIDLMHQWYAVLKRYFDTDIGLLGGGYNEPGTLTVATYDSALLHVESKGNRFGLLIFDECHHLPGEQYQYCAISSLAPFRLGLTATPERTDGRESRLFQICGNICYRANIRDLEGETLAPYDVETLELDLTPTEQEAYQSARQQYLDFLKQENINMGSARGWNYFLWRTSQSPAGRAAFKAYLAQKQLSLAASAKLAAIWDLLQRHRGDRIIIFTQDNEMAYTIGKRFLLPVLTHHTKLKEREAFLNAFRSGDYPVLVTSKVLNEGVDVPEANVGIVVSGSGSVREHVQRLGRLLRAQPGKRAMLYELIAKGTGEHFTNQRRRQHHAYRKPK